MGGCSFFHTIESKSERDAYEELREEAVSLYGHRSLNGTISTCDSCRTIKTFSTYDKKNLEKARKIAEDMDYGNKWEAYCIDLGIVYYLVRTVKKTNKTYDEKYKQKFVVCDAFTEKPLTPAKNYQFDTKPPADKKALQCTLGGKEVCVRKTMVKLSGNDTVSKFTVEEKKAEKKPKLKAMDNRVVIPIHKYAFFGVAAE